MTKQLININYRDYLLAGISQNRYDWDCLLINYRDYLLAGINQNRYDWDCLLARINYNAAHYSQFLLAGISLIRF
jgi:hypothetical protein